MFSSTLKRFANSDCKIISTIPRNQRDSKKSNQITKLMDVTCMCIKEQVVMIKRNESNIKAHKPLLLCRKLAVSDYVATNINASRIFVLVCSRSRCHLAMRALVRHCSVCTSTTFTNGFVLGVHPHVELSPYLLLRRKLVRKRKLSNIISYQLNNNECTQFSFFYLSIING